MKNHTFRMNLVPLPNNGLGDTRQSTLPWPRRGGGSPFQDGIGGEEGHHPLIFILSRLPIPLAARRYNGVNESALESS